MCNIPAPPAPQPRPVTWVLRAKSAPTAREGVLAGEMGARGQVLLWLQLCGRPRHPGVDPEAEGRHLRRGWDTDGGGDRGLPQFPRALAWAGEAPNAQEVVKPQSRPCGPSSPSWLLCAQLGQGPAPGCGLRAAASGPPLCSLCASHPGSFLRPVPPQTLRTPSRTASVPVNRGDVPWEGEGTLARALQIG